MSIFNRKKPSVKFNDNRSILTKVADANEKGSNFIRKWLPVIIAVIALGIVGTMDYEDQICKNPQSQQCQEYKNSK